MQVLKEEKDSTKCWVNSLMEMEVRLELHLLHAFMFPELSAWGLFILLIPKDAEFDTDYGFGNWEYLLPEGARAYCLRTTALRPLLEYDFEKVTEHLDMLEDKELEKELKSLTRIFPVPEWKTKGNQHVEVDDG